MRIGYDAKRAFNNTRGLGNYSRETIRVMTSLHPEIQFDLFTPTTRPDIDFNLPANAVKVMPSTSFAGAWWRTFSITKEVKKRGIDLYHGLSHELPYGIEKTGVPTVVTMHDLIFLKHPEYYPYIDRKLYQIKYLHSCQIATHIIAVSRQTKEDLQALAGIPTEKISVVYQGCHPQFLQEVSEERKRAFRQQHGLPDEYMLNLAAIEPRKNQLQILKAMAEGGIDFPLVIAGRLTAYLDELRRYGAEHALEGKVFFLPDIAFEDLPTLYQGASLFLYPSQYEGFGIPIVEALQSGVPVIATEGGCMEESGGPGSRYVNPDDTEALSNEIQRILSSRELQLKMIRQGKEYARIFLDENIANNIIKIYGNI